MSLALLPPPFVAPQDQLPSDSDDRPKWVVFKALKWILHITHRIMNRYSEPLTCAEGNDRAFAELFVVRGWWGAEGSGWRGAKAGGRWGVRAGGSGA